jgi:hypothetical protein
VLYQVTTTAASARNIWAPATPSERHLSKWFTLKRSSVMVRNDGVSSTHSLITTHWANAFVCLRKSNICTIAELVPVVS